MESVINHEYINTYSEAYANRILERYFSDRSTIDGEGILSLTDIRQVNLFIIKNLMVKWHAEAKKIRSPFFNYSSPEVQNALQDFMNVLSKNIYIEAKVFKPLFKMAVSDTLLLLFSPYDFFSTELLNIGSPVTLAELEKRKKFIKINSELYDAYIKKIESIGSDNIQIKEAKQYFDEVCEDINFSPEEPDEYISLFSREISVDSKKVYGEIDLEAQDEIRVTSGDEEKEEKVPIHAKFYEKKSMLIDELKKEPATTVLDFHQKQKIESIRKNISIQQRFRFVRELFDENDAIFSETIDHLENCTNLGDATDYLNEKFLDSGKWNNDDEVVTEFLSVVNKRFSD
jgi:hypothetical protein